MGTNIVSFFQLCKNVLLNDVSYCFYYEIENFLNAK